MRDDPAITRCVGDRLYCAKESVAGDLDVIRKPGEDAKGQRFEIAGVHPAAVEVEALNARPAGLTVARRARQDEAGAQPAK